MVKAGEVVDLCDRFADICGAELRGYTVCPHPTLDRNYLQYHGGFATVVKIIDSKNVPYALRLFSKSDEIVSEITSRIDAISNFIGNSDAPYFVGFKEVKEGLDWGGRLEPVVLMNWVEEPTLYDFITELIEDGDVHASEYFSNIARELKVMFRWLHFHKIAHGDLQLENIKCGNQGNSLILVDYDSLVIPGFETKSLITDGIRDFQHPLRQGGLCDLRIDYFSELVLYLGMLLLSIDKKLFKLNGKYLVFSRDDFTQIRRGEDNVMLKKVKTLLSGLSGNQEKKQLVDEIDSLLELLVYNLKVNSLVDIKPMPGLDGGYCHICGRQNMYTNRYCYNCGCLQRH